MPDKSQSAILAGAAVGIAAFVVNLIPMVGGCVACLLYVGSGVAAVWHYTDKHRITVKGGQGAGLGALAGIVAAVVASVLQWLFQALGVAPDWRVTMERQLENSGMDPAQMEQMIEMFTSPLWIAGFILIALAVGALAGAIGGAIGASIFKKGTGGGITEGGERL